MHVYDYAVTECTYTKMHSMDYALSLKVNFSVDKSSLKPSSLLSPLKATDALSQEGTATHLLLPLPFGLGFFFVCKVLLSPQKLN